MSSILIVGSLNIDLITTAPRLPAAGETLASTSFTTAPGGKGANQAVSCARLTHGTATRVAMIGATGTDAFGPVVTGALAAAGVDTSRVRTVAGATGVAVIIVDAATGENRILITRGANGAVEPGAFGDGFFDGGAWDAVVLQLEVPVETVARVLHLARRAGVRTVFNAAPAVESLPEECYACVDWLVVNETEAAALVGVDVAALDTELGVRAAAETFLERGVRAVVVTLGARGCFWKGAEGEGWVAVETKKEDVVDTTGAGDTFVGGLVVALVEGKGQAESVVWAGRAAGVAVTKSGAMAGVPWREEIV